MRLSGSLFTFFAGAAFALFALAATNLLNLPEITRNTIIDGFTESGSPVSITFMGHLYDEGTVLALAGAYQEATGFHLKRPPLFQ